MNLLVRLLPFILPPLLGAIIGYVTNAIAIRMLFRPLTEKRIFGLRLPFTPGIIPRQRYQLSQSIARMVSTKLLTEETIRQKLEDPEFRPSLLASVSRFTDDILNRQPSDRRSEEQQAVSGVHDLARSLLEGFFGSPSFRTAARTIVMAAIDGASNVQVGRLSPSEETIADLVSRLISAISSGAAGDAVEGAVLRWADTHSEKNTPLRQVVGEGVIARVSHLVVQAYDPLLDSLLAFLRRREIRRELEIHGRDLVKRILGRLTIIQRFFVSAGQYDRNLNDNMPAIVSDVIDSLERAGQNPTNRNQLVAAFEEKLAEIGDTGVADLGTTLEVDLQDAGRRVVRAGLELLGRDDVRSRVTTSIVAFLERHAETRLGEMLEDALGADPERLREAATRIVDEWLSRDESVTRITDVVMSFATDFLSRDDRRPLSDLVHLKPEQKERVDSFVTTILFEQMERRIPELLAGLDIHGMVVNKIDGLDIQSVEQLLLMVIAKHLKWINLFGALLGGIIGATQVVVSQFL